MRVFVQSFTTFQRCGISVCLWLCALTSSQADDVVMPTPPPTKVLKGQKNIGPAARYCIVHNAPLRASPDDKSSILGWLDYMEIVSLADGYPEKSGLAYLFNQEKRKDNTDWALVCPAESRGDLSIKEFYGWVPRRFLLDQLRAESDPKTGITKKAVVVFPTDLVRKAAEQGKEIQPLVPQLAPISFEEKRPDPNPDIPQPPELNLYRMCYIYAEYDHWVLLGTRPEVDGIDSAAIREDLLGWVPNERVARWNTRECFQWDRESFSDRQLPGELYLTAKDAIATHAEIADSGPVGHEAGIVESKPLVDRKGNLRPLSRGAMRFHLLMSPREAQIERIPGVFNWTKSLSSGEQNRLFKMGAVISLDGQNTNFNFEMQQEKLDRVADQTALTELLFVIDDTISMEVAFEAVANTIPQLWESTRKDAGGEVRIALCFYNDGETAKDAVEVEPLLTIRSKEDSGNLQDRLKNHKVVSDVDHSRLERVFDGISQGIFQAKFSEHSRKIVVIVGDCGDKQKLSPAAIQQMKVIAKQLVPDYGSFHECHIIQLKDPRQGDKYHKMFFEQLGQKLKEFYLARMDEVLGPKLDSSNVKPNWDKIYTYSSYHTPFRKSELNATELNEFVAKTVIPRFKESREQGLIIRGLTKRLLVQGDDSDATKKELAEIGIASQLIIKRLMEQVNIDDYLKVVKQAPYQEVYGRERSPLPGFNTKDHPSQLRRMILVSGEELDKTINVLQVLEQNYKKGLKLGLAEFMEEILQEAIGQQKEFPPEVETDLDKIRWLFKSLRFHSPIFEQYVNGITPQVSESSLIDVFLKLRLLKDIKNNLDAKAENYELVDENVLTYDIKMWQRKRTATGNEIKIPPRIRSFERYGVDNLWYYIDFENEWP